jgi:hypothetical protein
MRCCEKFIELLSSLPERFGVRLHGYALMGNHYHLQLESLEANLSKALHWLNVSYSVLPLEFLRFLRWKPSNTRLAMHRFHLGVLRSRRAMPTPKGVSSTVADHHNAVGIAIRRFTQRLQSDRTLLEKVALVQKELEPRQQPLLYCIGSRTHHSNSAHEKSALFVPNASNL